MSKIYYQQKQVLLGGAALQVNTNLALTSATSISITANTSIIRIYVEDSAVYLRYNATATSSAWDYIIPYNGVLDLYNIPSISSISILSTSSSKVFVAQY